METSGDYIAGFLQQYCVCELESQSEALKNATNSIYLLLSKQTPLLCTDEILKFKEALALMQELRFHVALAISEYANDNGHYEVL